MCVFERYQNKAHRGKTESVRQHHQAAQGCGKAGMGQAKQKAVQESKRATPGKHPDEPSSNTSANNASEQMVCAAKTVAVKGGSITYKGGKKLAQVTAKKLREHRRLIQKEEIRSNSIGRTDIVPSEAARLFQHAPSCFQDIPGHRRTESVSAHKNWKSNDVPYDTRCSQFCFPDR